jgi:ketosteroid isomerase-like protein
MGYQQSDGSADSSRILSSSPETEKELRAVVMKIWEDAAKGDIPALRSAHLDSPKFSKFGPRIAARQDVKSTNKTEADHFLSISDASFAVEDLKIDVFEDMAVTTFYNNYSFIKNKIRVQGKGRVTLVFLRTEEGWKIVHEHSSPFVQ